MDEEHLYQFIFDYANERNKFPMDYYNNFIQLLEGIRILRELGITITEKPTV